MRALVEGDRHSKTWYQVLNAGRGEDPPRVRGKALAGWASSAPVIVADASTDAYDSKIDSVVRSPVLPQFAPRQRGRRGRAKWPEETSRDGMAAGDSEGSRFVLLRRIGQLRSAGRIVHLLRTVDAETV